MKVDSRRAKRLYMPRNHSRLNQTSEDLLQSWRGNCDVQILIYDHRVDGIDPDDISRVTDYIVSYSCKGNKTLKEEEEQTKNLVSR